jgi:hypothetical protein
MDPILLPYLCDNSNSTTSKNVQCCIYPAGRYNTIGANHDNLKILLAYFRDNFFFFLYIYIYFPILFSQLKIETLTNNSKTKHS